MLIFLNVFAGHKSESIRRILYLARLTGELYKKNTYQNTSWLYYTNNTQDKQRENKI